MEYTKKQNIELLQATKDDCDLYRLLTEGVRSTREHQTIILSTDDLAMPLPEGGCTPEILVTDCDSFTAAAAFKEKKTCVVNFGSATVQGGGAQIGACQQEASLCRTSTLFKSIAYKDIWDQYYLPHRSEPNPIHTGDILYSPDIIVFKAEEDPASLFPDEDWFHVDVLTISMPNLAKNPSDYSNYDGDETAEIGKAELLQIYEERLSRVLQAAHNHGVQALILPYPEKHYKTDPQMLAKAAEKVVAKYGGWFDTIQFAISLKYNSKKALEELQKTFLPGDMDMID